MAGHAAGEYCFPPVQYFDLLKKEQSLAHFSVYIYGKFTK
jgi:hypothetical protein